MVSQKSIILITQYTFCLLYCFIGKWHFSSF